MGKLTMDDIHNANLEHWRPEGGVLKASYRTNDFATGARFVAAIAEAADAADHHPDVLLTYPSVDITLVSHDVAAITDRDIALAREISRIAAALKIKAAADD